MNYQIINKIKLRMEKELDCCQLQKLERVLLELFEDEELKNKESNQKNNLIQQFINAKKIEGCSKRTEEYYSSTLLYFEKNIKKDICFIQANEIREYLTNYQSINNCSNVTIDTIRRILSSFYKWLEDEDYIIKSPMRKIHRIKSPVIIKPTLTDEQIEIIRKEANGNIRNLAIIDLMLSSGIRVGELVSLNRSSINLNSRSCLVLGKGSKQREIYFDVRTKIELINYLKTRKDKNKALFVSSRRKHKNGVYSRLRINSIEKIIREIGLKTDIENIHPHRFRRTLATRAIDKGMPIEQVQVLLGHSKIETTLRYANVHQANVHISHEKYIC